MTNMFIELFQEFSIIMIVLLLFPMLLLCAVFSTQLIALLAMSMQRRRDGHAVSAGEVKDARHKLAVTAALLAIFPAVLFVVDILLPRSGAVGSWKLILVLLAQAVLIALQVLFMVMALVAPVCFLVYGIGWLSKILRKKKQPDAVREEELNAAKYKFLASGVLLLATQLLYGVLWLFLKDHIYVPDIPSSL